MSRLVLRYLLFSLFAWLSLTPAWAQNTTLVLDTTKFNSVQLISLSNLDGWVYAPGHNPDWANPTLNTANWRRFKPADLSIKDADKNGKVEGWFRLNIRLDSTWKGIALGIRNGSWAATDVYLDGQLVVSFGNTGTNGKPYSEHYHIYSLPEAIRLAPGQVHSIALHLVDYVSPFPNYAGRKLKSEVFSGTTRIIQLAGPRYPSILQEFLKKEVGYRGVWFGTWLLMVICFWLLSWLNFSEKRTLQLLAAGGTFATISNLGRLLLFTPSSFTVLYEKFSILITLSLWLTISLVLLTLMSIFGYRINRRRVSIFISIAVAGAALDTYVGDDILISIANFIQQLAIIYLLISSWKQLQGAQWAIVGGALVSILASALYGVFLFAQLSFNFNILYSIISLAFPISFLIYIALRFKEILAEVRAKAAAVVQITEEKRAILEAQNQLLEQQVDIRTAELKASQAQLIQKEKLASLGELTAGIAHEIQNPLNFVNNFSEVSTELLDELKDGPIKKLPDSEKYYAEEILADLTSNLKKINHHGERASSIVKGMLEHSRTESGEKRPTDLNALADEYLKIAYHGLRAKDKNGSASRFNCELVTDFDSTLGAVDIAPQEIGRVLLNLYNNAFYAVNQRHIVETRHALSLPEKYQPTLKVSTKKMGNQVVISVSDNGTGIPESVKAKIFQPFFTTKPTGEGTGLGLSLSYDIITKGHNGTLTMTSRTGEGTEFTLQLPVKS